MSNSDLVELILDYKNVRKKFITALVQQFAWGVAVREHLYNQQLLVLEPEPSTHLHN
jgi:hypothetical protein